jgi:hypothetical protein
MPGANAKHGKTLGRSYVKMAGLRDVQISLLQSTQVEGIRVASSTAARNWSAVSNGPQRRLNRIFLVNAGASIEQPGMDNIGFHVPDIRTFAANLGAVKEHGFVGIADCSKHKADHNVCRAPMPAHVKIRRSVSHEGVN